LAPHKGTSPRPTAGVEHELATFFSTGRRRRRPPVHGVLPPNPGDVRERPRRHEDGFVAADDGAVEEPDDAKQVPDDVRRGVAGHSWTIADDVGATGGYERRNAASTLTIAALDSWMIDEDPKRPWSTSSHTRTGHASAMACAMWLRGRVSSVLRCLNADKPGEM
jgi:hypothetical protein